eukprot:361293-Chlamydomonas_euryale.AAC.2
MALCSVPRTFVLSGSGSTRVGGGQVNYTSGIRSRTGVTRQTDRRTSWKRDGQACARLQLARIYTSDAFLVIAPTRGSSIVAAAALRSDHVPVQADFEAPWVTARHGKAPPASCSCC